MSRANDNKLKNCYKYIVTNNSSMIGVSDDTSVNINT